MPGSKGNNPGKNEKGQKSRAKEHHKGKLKLHYIENPESRAQAISKRHPTILKKMKELSTLTKTEFHVQWHTQSGSVGTFKTDGYSTGANVEEPSSTEIGSEEAEVSDISAEPSYPPPPSAVPSNDTAMALSTVTWHLHHFHHAH